MKKEPTIIFDSDSKICTKKGFGRTVKKVEKKRKIIDYNDLK